MKQKILLADDDPSIIETFSEIIRKNFLDYGLETFQNGIFLKRRLEERTEDVGIAITDHQMPVYNNQIPRIDGDEMVRDYAKRVPMLMVYGGHKSIGEQAIKDGAFGYLLKPTKSQHYITAVETVLYYSVNNGKRKIN